MLNWYDAQGARYLAADEQATVAQQQIIAAENRANEAERRSQLFEEKLRELGVESSELG